MRKKRNYAGNIRVKNQICESVIADRQKEIQKMKMKNRYFGFSTQEKIDGRKIKRLAEIPVHSA